MIWGLLIFAQNALLPTCNKEVRNVLAVVLIIIAVVCCGWLSLAILLFVLLLLLLLLFRNSTFLKSQIAQSRFLTPKYLLCDKTTSVTSLSNRTPARYVRWP